MLTRGWIAGLLIVLWLGDASRSANAEDSVSVQTSAGATRFFGDLAGSDVGFGLDVQVKTLFVRIGDSRFSAHLGFDLLLAWTDHVGTQFPFALNADLALRGFLFLPNLCWDASTSTRICGAIGQGTVNVNADGDRRDYGSWNYELSARVKIHKGLFANVSAKYVGQVEQQVGGVDSSFAVGLVAAGVGWVW